MRPTASPFGGTSIGGTVVLGSVVLTAGSAVVVLAGSTSVGLLIATPAWAKGGHELLLEPSDNPIAEAYRTGLYAAGIPAIVFGVSELHDEYDRLEAAGVHFTGEPVTDPSGIYATFDDTFGNWIRLHED